MLLVLSMLMLWGTGLLAGQLPSYEEPRWVTAYTAFDGSIVRSPKALTVMAADNYIWPNYFGNQTRIREGIERFASCEPIRHILFISYEELFGVYKQVVSRMVRSILTAENRANDVRTARENSSYLRSIVYETQQKNVQPRPFDDEDPKGQAGMLEGAESRSLRPPQKCLRFTP